VTGKIPKDKPLSADSKKQLKMRNGKKESRLKRGTGKTVTEIPSSIKQLQCLQKETEVQWIPSHCMVLGNNETANNGTISMWKLRIKSFRLRDKARMHRYIQLLVHGKPTASKGLSGPNR
jgi:hypothetical protein